MKKEISVSNFYHKDDDIWNNIKQRLSGTYMLTTEEFEKANKNIKIITALGEIILN